RDGWLWTATNGAQVDAWRRTVEAIERHGHQPFVALGQDEVERRTGSSAHRGGVFERVAATLQPAMLVRGMRRVALERGVRIFEHSPMVDVRRDAPLVVRTPCGRIRADRVVIAMNAWSSALRELR